MLQQEKPDDFVLATGENHIVREFADLSFIEIGMELEWIGNNEKEKGIERKTGKVRVEVDPSYFRPTEVDLLIGDPQKAKDILWWQPKTSFNELVKIMVQADLEKVKKKVIKQRTKPTPMK